jgi:hypothetical protein
VRGTGTAAQSTTSSAYRPAAAEAGVAAELNTAGTARGTAGGGAVHERANRRWQGENSEILNSIRLTWVVASFIVRLPSLHTLGRCSGLHPRTNLAHDPSRKSQCQRSQRCRETTTQRHCIWSCAVSSPMCVTCSQNVTQPSVSTPCACPRYAAKCSCRFAPMRLPWLQHARVLMCPTQLKSGQKWRCSVHGAAHSPRGKTVMILSMFV